MKCRMPDRVLCEAGCIEEAYSVIQGDAVLAVFGASFAEESGLVDRICTGLEKAGKKVYVFSGVKAEPDTDTVEECRLEARDKGTDSVMSIGGGSVLDVGKAAAGLYSSKGAVLEYMQGKEIRKPGLFFCAVPTTAGTGSEATSNSVLTDRYLMEKKSIRAPHMVPDLVVLDPELTRTCPSHITAYSGMDAMVQGIESLFSNGSNLFSQGFAVSGLSKICRSIEAAYRDGNNMNAREEMLYGAFFVGAAFAHSRLGAVHGLAHPIGLFTDTPHGLVCARVIVPVLKRNREAAPDAYQTLYDICKRDPIDYITECNNSFGIESGFDIEITCEQFERILEYTAVSGSMKANPVQFSEEEQKEILTECGISIKSKD